MEIDFRILGGITAALAGLLKLADLLSDGALSRSVKRGARILAGFGSRSKESSRIRNLLEDKLRADGYQGLSLGRWKHVLELAESFSVSLAPLSASYDAQSLIPALGQWIDERQEVFSLASESGNGKTVLAMLLPLLCQRSPKLGCAALYLGPADWANGPPTARVQEWIARWPAAKRKLILFDSLNEILVDPAPLRELLAKVREQSPSGCGFVVLYRPVSAKYAEEISSTLSSAFGKKALELRLHFDSADTRQCAVYRHLFPDARIRRDQVSYLLRIYAGLFPGYDPTRLSAVFVLRHLYDRFRTPPGPPQAAEPPVSPPGDVLFDAILFPGIKLDDPGVDLLSRIALDLVKEGRHSAATEIELLKARLRQDGYPVRNLGDLLAAARDLFREGSMISVQMDSRTVRIPNDTHVQALAALRIARMIDTSDGNRLSHELEQFLGRSKYDVCAPFVLPAYRRIHGRAGALYEVTAGFLEHEDAPFSFCAQLIHSNYDFSLLSREESEELSNRLFRKLIQGIDLDRRTTCEQSIRNAPAGPNPILDQLFEVTAAYRDSVVRLLVDNVLLTSQTDLEKSQGAYLILHWLNRLFASPEPETLRARRHHVYTILNGLEVLKTANLHIRFHVMEVLDFLGAHSKLHLEAMPGFRKRLEQLLERYSQAPERVAAAGSPKAAAVYEGCNRLVSSWAAGTLKSGFSPDSLPRIADEALPPLLSDFGKLLAELGLDNPDRAELAMDESELEPLLECYEVLLGLTRRTYHLRRSPRLLGFLEQAAECPLWIVRWWAFYNVSHLVSDLPVGAEYNSAVSSCLAWMIEQVHRTPEPIGLKHRQCALLEAAVQDRTGAREMVRRHLGARPPFDEARVLKEYTHILDSDTAASDSLEEYFRKLRRLHEEYR